MNTLLQITSTFTPLSLSSFTLLPSSHSSSTIQYSKLGFCSPKLLRISQFHPSFQSPNSLSSVENQLSDADEDEFDDEDDEAAEEYDEISGDVTGISGDLEEDDEVDTQEAELNASFWSSNDSKLERVQKLCDEVKEFGSGFIDVDELASIYDFRIDKFQVFRSFLFIYVMYFWFNLRIYCVWQFTPLIIGLSFKMFRDWL